MGRIVKDYTLKRYFSFAIIDVNQGVLLFKKVDEYLDEFTDTCFSVENERFVSQRISAR